MAPSDDPSDAADRLEQALERIASLAEHRHDAVASPDSAPGTQEVAARLDALIAQLRTALGTAGD